MELKIMILFASFFSFLSFIIIQNFKGVRRVFFFSFFFFGGGGVGSFIIFSLVFFFSFHLFSNLFHFLKNLKKLIYLV